MSTPADWTTGAPAITYDECRTCGRRWTLPRTGCPECGAPDPRRQVSAGHGHVAAVTVVHRSPEEQYTLVLVDLDEGVRVMGRAAPGLVVGAGVRVGFGDDVPTFVGS